MPRGWAKRRQGVALTLVLSHRVLYREALLEQRRQQQQEDRRKEVEDEMERERRLDALRQTVSQLTIHTSQKDNTRWVPSGLHTDLTCKQANHKLLSRHSYRDQCYQAGKHSNMLSTDYFPLANVSYSFVVVIQISQ